MDGAEGVELGGGEVAFFGAKLFRRGWLIVSNILLIIILAR